MQEQTGVFSVFRGVRPWILATLVLVLLASAGLRLRGLESRGMGHTESYTPNIELPSDYGEPRARLTLPRTIINSLWEPHPPGWYVFMFAWTKAVGTSLTAIRLPAALFGVLVVLLTFALGRMESDPLTALIGATLVGLNGHQILWSQISRPATLLCALGLLSTMLLVLAMRQSSRRYAWGYVAVVLAGVMVEHYFWFLFAGQIAYCILRYRLQPDTALGLMRYQLLALIAASPLLSLMVFQGGARQFDPNAQSTISDLLAFGFLVEHDLLQAETTIDAIRPAVAILGGILTLTGLWAFRSGFTAHRPSAAPLSGPSFALTAAVAFVSTGAIPAVVRVLARASPDKYGSMLAAVVVPLGALVASYVLWRHSRQVAAILDRVVPRIGGADGLPAIVVALVGPLALAGTVSLWKPLLASRHLQMFVPFLLLVMARGLVSLGSVRPRWISAVAVWIFVAGTLGAYVQAYQYQSTARPGPHDYRGLAEVWVPRIEPSDVILVRDHFRTTPLFYYMKPSRFNFIGLNHVAEIQRRNPARVWVFHVTGWRDDPAIDKAVEGYRRVAEVTARNTRADLYERKNAP
jgi:hypothetical protein